MTRRPRRNHTAVYKAKVALAALKGDKLSLCESSSLAGRVGGRTYAFAKALPRKGAASRQRFCCAFAAW